MFTSISLITFSGLSQASGNKCSKHYRHCLDVAVNMDVYNGNDGAHVTPANSKSYAAKNTRLPYECGHSNCDVRFQTAYKDSWGRDRWQDHWKNDTCEDLVLKKDASGTVQVVTGSSCN